MLGVFGKERGEWFRIASVQRLGRDAELVDHRSSMARDSLIFMTVEILFFAGCPNYEQTRELVECGCAAAGVDPELRLIEVTSREDAERLRFLGSPSVHVNGRDVEPGADERETFTLACRIYRTESGVSGQPPAEWIRAALAG